MFLWGGGSSLESLMLLAGGSENCGKVSLASLLGEGSIESRRHLVQSSLWLIGHGRSGGIAGNSYINEMQSRVSFLGNTVQKEETISLHFR
ncbi:hypothetical protein GDO86_017501 [Hymenochirus boettgeri]|uniref:Uncharacterized protein n=1 Tax=Hymenochirus boettgeri TaxID=247094 RepID=A0A8T2IRZ1_9PIPI|nr:hypothetical protein GDO86_017501 [Hymenochirus boettgeri]